MTAEVLNGTVEAGDTVSYAAIGGMRIGTVLEVHEFRGKKRLKIQITHGIDAVGKIVFYPYLREVAKIG